MTTSYQLTLTHLSGQSPSLFSPAYVSHVSLFPFYSPPLRPACFPSIHHICLPVSQVSLLFFYSPTYINPSLRSVCLPSIHSLSGQSASFPFTSLYLPISQVSMLSFYSPAYIYPSLRSLSSIVFTPLRPVCSHSIHQLMLTHLSGQSAFSFIHQLTLTHLSSQSASLLFTSSQASLLPFHSPAYVYQSLR